MILVIGGDHLGSITGNLEQLGLGPIRHVKGRTEKTVEIPAEAALILVLVDYVNHNLARWVKAQAKARQVPILFARRSWSAICQSLMSCRTCPQVARCAQALVSGQAVG